MSEIDKQDSQQQAVPFFARYLEGQISFMEDLSEEEAQAVGGGVTFRTRKYPSHNEEHGGGGGMVVTLKFPSDNEEGGGDQIAVTRKYPSDKDDYFAQ